MENGAIMGNGAAAIGIVWLFGIVIYLGILIFFVWAILSAVRSLAIIAEGQKETSAALQEIAGKFGDK